MSNSQYQTFEPYGSLDPSDPYGADPAPEPSAYASPTDLHSAETLYYGVYAAPTPYDDTYRPAYEAPPYEAPPYEPSGCEAPPYEPRQYELRQYGPPLYERPPYESPGPVLRRGTEDVHGADTHGADASAPFASAPFASARVASASAPSAPVARKPVTPVTPTLVAPAGTGRRAARHRARYAERPDSTMRRLLPQALVVAFLAGGTTAFVAEDKAVELTVDGKPRVLHTFADDVTELLAEEGLRVGTHDVVAPAPGTALASGDEIAVGYGRPVRLTLDGHRREVWTTARTVEEALDQLGVRAEGAYLSISRSQRIGRAGLALDVRTERALTIMADGRARTVRTNAATVREVVEEAGITLRGQDTTSVPPGSFPRDGQTVTVLRITGSREVREEAIPFQVRRTEDPSLFKGTEIVERAGQPGLRRETYLVRTVNGVRQKPRRIRSEVVRGPRAQVVKVGTKPLPASVRGADNLNWQGLAACESGGRPDAVDPSGTYGGLYQFDTRTWQSLGGSGRPQDASAAEQTYRAKKLYMRRGTSPWPHCGSRLRG
ncbi:ubiquitin-like domain-containing protein [Streptomyces sp. NPDC014995]|uniref:ubiquitin-like domain-containing protein n=1 Tax=Streptomyces sp. NPDC014995 TaxID=3364936 RepID=UPI0036FEEAEC